MLTHVAFPCRQEEHSCGWLPAEEDGARRVLASANRLFLKIRASLSRCTKLVSRGMPLLGLTQAFQVRGDCDHYALCT